MESAHSHEFDQKEKLSRELSIAHDMDEQGSGDSDIMKKEKRISRTNVLIVILVIYILALVAVFGFFLVKDHVFHHKIDDSDFIAPDIQHDLEPSTVGMPVEESLSSDALGIKNVKMPSDFKPSHLIIRSIIASALITVLFVFGLACSLLFMRTCEELTFDKNSF